MHLQIAISSQLSVTSVTKQAILLKHVRQESPRKANKLFRRALKAGMHNVEEGLSPRPEIADIIHIHTSLHIPRSYKVLTTINSIPVTMDINTGAGVTIVSETTWAEKLNKPDLQDCSIALHSYPNRSLNVMGSCSVEVPINGQTKHLPLVVVEGDGISHLGRNWLEAIKLNWTENACVNNISRPSKLDKLLAEYDEIFVTNWAIANTKQNFMSNLTQLQSFTDLDQYLWQ